MFYQYLYIGVLLLLDGMLLNIFEQVSQTVYLTGSVRRSGLVVSALDSRSGGVGLSPAITCDGLASHPRGVAILLSLHATETRISSGSYVSQAHDLPTKKCMAISWVN